MNIMKKNLALFLLISGSMFSQTYIYTAKEEGVQNGVYLAMKPMCKSASLANGGYTYGNSSVGYWFFGSYSRIATQATLNQDGLANYHFATFLEWRTLVDWLNTGITPGSNITDPSKRALFDKMSLVPFNTVFYFTGVWPGTPPITFTFTKTQVLSTDQFTTSPILVYPNPTSSILNIDFNQGFIGTLYDFTGKKQMDFSTKTVDISQLSSGSYLLEIISKEKRYSKKIIKN